MNTPRRLAMFAIAIFAVIAFAASLFYVVHMPQPNAHGPNTPSPADSLSTSTSQQPLQQPPVESTSNASHPDSTTMKTSSFTLSQIKEITVQTPISHYSHGNFFGNDPIDYAWQSSYPLVTPVIYLLDKSTDVYFAKLSPGYTVSSAKAGSALPGNLNLQTGIYNIALCDLGTNGQDGQPICGWSGNFNITATTAPFQI